MKKAFSKVLAVLLTAVLFVSIAGAAFAESSSVVESFGLKETTADASTAELFEAEFYNYKVLRNVPVAFESKGWNNYIVKAGPMESMKVEELGEADAERIRAAKQAREELVQVTAEEDSRWFLWGESIPSAEDVTTLVFSVSDEDNADFKPYLVPYLLEDQGNVKGNLIVIAGGGYGARNNSGEGYPIAKAFNKLGFNAFVLQRRVSPYSAEDVWMDFQRSVRYLRHYGEEIGLGGMDCIAAAGFSGGSATILGTLVNLYGDIQPTVYDANYVSDAVDAESSDFDIAYLIYGPNWYPTHDAEYFGFIGDNSNLPAMYIAAGADDNTGAPADCLTLFSSVKDKTLAELHIFANVGHGFGVGLYGTNSDYWIAMADTFADIAKNKAVMEQGGIPAEYTQEQTINIPFVFGDTEAKAYANENATKFMVTFSAFGDAQVMEGVIDEEGGARVAFDLTGFFSNDIQMIADSLDPTAWTPME